MKTTLLTLLLLLATASAARIPSRKVAAPTNAEYSVPASSPTTPSRNVMPPTNDASRIKSIVVEAVPEPVRPKIMTSPTAPLVASPKDSIQQDLSAEQASEQPLIASMELLMEDEIVHQVVDESTMTDVINELSSSSSVTTDESTAVELTEEREPAPSPKNNREPTCASKSCDNYTDDIIVAVKPRV